ncbi:hypothetical protein L0337_27960 [candidate division KSB1 bacterium]|nr:hypothetical protein [candidate division KSB1 bacterium]
MPRTAPTNNENWSATVHRCNAKALYSAYFRGNLFCIKHRAGHEQEILPE